MGRSVLRVAVQPFNSESLWFCTNICLSCLLFQDILCQGFHATLFEEENFLRAISAILLKKKLYLLWIPKYFTWEFFYYHYVGTTEDYSHFYLLLKTLACVAKNSAVKARNQDLTLYWQRDDMTPKDTSTIIFDHPHIH